MFKEKKNKQVSKWKMNRRWWFLDQCNFKDKQIWRTQMGAWLIGQIRTIYVGWLTSLLELCSLTSP